MINSALQFYNFTSFTNATIYVIFITNFKLCLFKTILKLSCQSKCTLVIRVQYSQIKNKILAGINYNSDSQPGFRGTLRYREHFLGVPRDGEIKNKWYYQIFR
jgi:hypothetical protein